MMRKRFPRLTSSLVLLATLTPLDAYADGTDALSGLAPVLLRAFGSLGAVIALIALLAWLLRRFRESTTTAQARGNLASGGRLDLGAKREIRLVQVHDRTLVLGVTEGRIELLTELEGSACEATPVESMDGESTPPVFRVLQKLASSP